MQVTWTIGGPQGMGVDTSATLFGNIVCSAGFRIYGEREYHSNIKGRHSFFKIVFSEGNVRSMVRATDILATFEPQTIFEHFTEVRKFVIYDKAAESTDIEKANFMEPELRKEAATFLTARGYGTTAGEAVRYMTDRGVKAVAINYRQLLTDVSRNIKLPYPVIDRSRNTVAVSASCALLGISKDSVLNMIRSAFRKEPFTQLNLNAAEAGYSIVKKEFDLPGVSVNAHRVLVDGNTLSALGKMYGGLRFQSYYPITPASDESTYIEANQILGEGQDMDGVIVIQTEDEISAVNMAIGSALTGARSATATSGPGFSLMSEGLSWAGMNEVPLVVTDYIRGGPSTGLPTRSGQEDLQFALHAGHGEFPRIVLASCDVCEVFSDAAWAMNLAEKYQMPVVHLIEKALANAFVTIDEEKLSIPDYRIERGRISRETGMLHRFAYEEDGISPRVFLGQGSIFYTGDEHNDRGHMREYSANRIAMYEKRMKKLDTADREIPAERRVQSYGSADAGNIILSWGSTRGVLLDALDILNREKAEFRLVQIKMFSPFPAEHIGRLLEGAKRIIAVENNYSAQAAAYVREKTGIGASNEILKFNGMPMFLEEVVDALRFVPERNERRVVLNG